LVGIEVVVLRKDLLNHHPALPSDAFPAALQILFESLRRGEGNLNLFEGKVRGHERVCDEKMRRSKAPSAVANPLAGNGKQRMHQLIMILIFQPPETSCLLKISPLHSAKWASKPFLHAFDSVPFRADNRRTRYQTNLGTGG
jgi:hypothetical protein